MFLAITRKNPTKQEPAASLEVLKAFIEINGAEVVRNIAAGVAVEYYTISLAAQNATLKRVSLKAGPRVVAREREIVEVEAGGKVVASAEIDA